MKREILSPELKRFVESIPTVACLEAILLLRDAGNQPWDIKTIARRLYMPERAAADLMQALCEAEICVATGSAGGFVYRPAAPRLQTLIDELARLYARNLIEITNIIHARPQANYPSFDQAFLWREPE